MTVCGTYFRAPRCTRLIGLAAEHLLFVVGRCEKDISVVSGKREALREPWLRTRDSLNGITMSIGHLPIAKMSYINLHVT
jgi:hypothetical protein